MFDFVFENLCIPNICFTWASSCVNSRMSREARVTSMMQVPTKFLLRQLRNAGLINQVSFFFLPPLLVQNKACSLSKSELRKDFLSKAAWCFQCIFWEMEWAHLVSSLILSEFSSKSAKDWQRVPAPFFEIALTQQNWSLISSHTSSCQVSQIST